MVREGSGAGCGALRWCQWQQLVGWEGITSCHHIPGVFNDFSVIEDKVLFGSCIVAASIVICNAAIQVMAAIVMNGAAVNHGEFVVRIRFGHGSGRVGSGAVIGDIVSLFHVARGVVRWWQ